MAVRLRNFTSRVTALTDELRHRRQVYLQLLFDYVLFIIVTHTADVSLLFASPAALGDRFQGLFVLLECWYVAAESSSLCVTQPSNMVLGTSRSCHTASVAAFLVLQDDASHVVPLL